MEHIHTGALQPTISAAALPQSHNSIQVKFESDTFAIHFNRDDKLVTDFTVEAYSPEGVLIGTLEFGAMTIAESRKICEELMGYGSFKLPHDLDTHLAAIEILSATLTRADEMELSFQSDLGEGAAEIVAEYGDARNPFCDTP